VPRAAEPGVVEAPGGLPLVGHLAAFHRDRLGFLDACRATGGPVVRLRFARPTYLLLEPEDIGHALVSYATYAKTDRLTDGRGQRAVGGGVLVAREGLHRDQRRTVRHVLSARRLERFGERVVAQTDRTIDGERTRCRAGLGSRAARASTRRSG
jgi:cyclooctat-9-en-7-ol 5-monooxygenase